MEGKTTMTRDEMLKFIRNNPNVKIKHESFDKDEYLYYCCGIVYDENEYVFEDFEAGSFRNGLRIRIGDCWETGWSLYKES